MSNASQRAFGAAQRERNRRVGLSLEGELPIGSLAVTGEPGWDAFFGSLREKEQAARGAGMGFRASLGDIGRFDSDSADIGSLNPFERESLKFAAIRRQSDDDVMRAKLERAAQDAMVNQQRDQLVGDLKQSDTERQIASAYATPEPSSVTSDIITPDGQRSVSIRNARPETERERILAQLPPPLRAAQAAQWAAQDTAAQKNAVDAAKALEAERHNRALEDKPKDERLVQVMGPQGTPIWVKESDAAGKPAAQAPRAVTGAERQALSFFNRAQDAVKTLTEGDTNSLEHRMAAQSLAGQAQLGYQGPGANLIQSAEQQQYRQAQRAFTEARLRKESGAAIPESEFKNDARTYFVQPGDDAKTVEQKRLSRQKVLDGLAFAAGKAYDEFYGEPRPNPNAKATNEGAPKPTSGKRDFRKEFDY